MFVLLCFGLINLVVINGKALKDLSNKNCVRVLFQPGARGKILDRDGSVIVDNELSYDVLILPQDARQRQQDLQVVSQVLNIRSDDLEAVFRKNFIAKSVPVMVAGGLDKKKAIALEELKTTMPGIIVQPRPKRRYPLGNFACHVIGYLSQIDRWRLTKLEDYGYKTKDTVGFGGVEEKFDYYLRQEEGGLSVEVDHKGRFTRVLGFKPPVNGKDIQLTLSLKIQKIVEAKLKDKKGSIIIMEPYTGEVLAMANFPDFNPQAFVDNQSASISGLFNNRDSPLINRAISASYPPGSVFKAVVSTAALETGKINSSTTFNCRGSVQIGKQKFACSETHGDQSLIPALAHSCNTFFYRTGLLTGAQVIHDYAVKFGLSRVTSFELPYETAGFIPSPLLRKINNFKNWYDGDTANLSIGQGDCLATPLQIARMMCVFANKGNLVTPHIIKAIGLSQVNANQRKSVPLGIKENTINDVREGLRNVVFLSTGTANVLAALPVSAAGKTGTAQAPGGQPHAWFAGFFPFEKPEFVICVFLEHGGSGHVAVAVAKEIAQDMIKEGLI